MESIMDLAYSLAPNEIYANESRLNDFAEGMQTMRIQLTEWMTIATDKDGFGTDLALMAIEKSLPILLKEKDTGEYIAVSDASSLMEWMGDLSTKPHRYLWRKIETL